MNFPFLLSLKYGVETTCTGLRTMQENCKYITDNDFLTEQNDPHQLFIDYCISSYRHRDAFLKSQEELLFKVTYIIHKECKHDWVIDWVDETPDKTNRIKYCQYCELTEA
jgi:hypothetical protein